MLSATLLLSVWALYLNYFDANKKEENNDNSGLLWCILFGCSLATVSGIYLLQINLLPSLVANQWAIGVESAASLAYLVYTFSQKSLLCKLISPFNREIKLTRLLILTGITSMLVFTILTPAPLNWDSNAYNVARISTFLSNASSILAPSTASGRQAIYAVGHDILLYPDISFGILRGLPMVSLLEFIVLLGALLNIASTLDKTTLIDKTKAIKATGLITTILLFNSNQQVMQALITKNDLAITLLFSISIGTGLVYIFARERALSDELIMATLFLMLCTAINMKSYGIILLIPTGLIAVIIITRRLLGRQPENMVAKSNKARALHKLLITLSISMLMSFSIQTSVVHQAWLHSVDNRVESITSAWTNKEGSWSERLENSWVNSGRILLQGSLFPYTSLKPYLPIGPELKSPINNSIIPKVLQGSNGSGSGTFSLLYGTNPDMAYPFLGFQLGLVLGLVGWCLGRPVKGYVSALFILISSGLTFLFFSTTLLYQPWISRFMGPVYIPLAPLAAIGIHFLLQRLFLSKYQLEGSRKGLIQIGALLAGILPLISSISLTGYISRRAGMPQGKSDFYYQYLRTQTGLSEQKAKILVEELRSNKFNYRYLCSSDGPWTLTPMVLSQSNQSFRKDNVELLSTEKCQEILTSVSRTRKKLEPGESIQINGKEFINLP